MTIITLIHHLDGYFVEADRDGAIAADYSRDSALAKWQAAGYRNPHYICVGALLEVGHWRMRLYTIPGDFAAAVPILEAALVDTTLYRSRSPLWVIRYLYRLKDAIGAAWYAQAEDL